MAALDIATHKLAHAFKEGLIDDMGPVFVGRDALPPPGALSQLELGALLAQDRPPIAGSSGLPPCSLPGEASRVVEATRAALSLCRRISEEAPEEEVRGLPGLRLCSYLDPYLDLFRRLYDSPAWWGRGRSGGPNPYMAHLLSALLAGTVRAIIEEPSRLTRRAIIEEAFRDGPAPPNLETEGMPPRVSGRPPRASPIPPCPPRACSLGLDLFLGRLLSLYGREPVGVFRESLHLAFGTSMTYELVLHRAMNAAYEERVVREHAGKLGLTQRGHRIPPHATRTGLSPPHPPHEPATACRGGEGPPAGSLGFYASLKHAMALPLPKRLAEALDRVGIEGFPVRATAPILHHNDHNDHNSDDNSSWQAGGRKEKIPPRPSHGGELNEGELDAGEGGGINEGFANLFSDLIQKGEKILTRRSRPARIRRQLDRMEAADRGTKYLFRGVLVQGGHTWREACAASEVMRGPRHRTGESHGGPSRLLMMMSLQGPKASLDETPVPFQGALTDAEALAIWGE